MDIKLTSDTELKNIYQECRNVRDSVSPDKYNSKYLLDVYNSMFDTPWGILHAEMVERVFTIVKNEMAERFFNQK